MSEDKSFVVPDFIAQLADTLYERQKKKKEAEVLRRKREEEKEERRLRKRLKDGLQYAEKIFVWAEAFRKSAPAQKLFEVGDGLLHHGTNVIFFDGHLKKTEWIGLGVTEKDMYWIGSWYMASERSVESPEELAEDVETKILELACEWIDNGDVWRCIKRRLTR